MRKLVIGIVSFTVVILGFWGYVLLMDTAPIQTPDADDVPDIIVPPSETTSQTTGDTKLGVVGRTRYPKYDPVTKELVAVYGFEELLNPGEGSSRWRVEKPYLVFYKPDYQCRIESKRGTIQIESAGSQKIPKDAQLNEDVVIRITPNQGSQIDETTIHMDDLTFSSERSEFATDGPLTVKSDRLQMDGYGMLLIFNTGQGRIEYLQIKDLELLQLKGFASSESPLINQTTARSDGANPQRTQSQGRTSGNDDVEAQKTTADSSDLYQCAIHDNVVIEYGNELIVSGAKQVNIQNIVMASLDKVTQSDTAKQEETMTSSSSQSPSESRSVNNDREAGDIIVRCDGGMIVQPMAQPSESEKSVYGSSLAFEMSGTPLKIDRVILDRDQKIETLAHCGSLSYKPAEDVLHMFTNALQPQILLNTQESNSRIETSGNVFWDRKAQRANIAGPGKVYIGNAKKPAAEPSEIAFNGVMDLMFARLPGNTSSATIQTINLTGGMDAILRQNGTLKTLADSAVLEFGKENQISQAQLDGDVYFESFEAGKSSSRAASKSATFYFNDNQIAMADLKGSVHFASAAGQMDSSNATIEFEADDAGTMHPKLIRTSEQAVLQTIPAVSEQKPAKFEAQRIDYDLQSGSGLAHGPIRFTFYQQSDPNGPAIESWLPVTITADRNAEFISGSDHRIEKVVFNENVIALRVTETPLYTQRDEFHGDKLIVGLAEEKDGSIGINKVTFTGGKVSGQSIKTRGEEKLFHARLTCEEMTLTGSSHLVVSGPGEIRLDNSHAEPEEMRTTGVNFERPCYALISGFDMIRWDFDAQQILADGDEETMQLAYVPLVDGVPEKYIYVSSMQFVTNFITDSMGKTSLGHVYTDKGITFTEKAENNKDIIHTLVGQTLDYNPGENVGWLKITGSESNPAMINGARVPEIYLNVNTGQIETSLSRIPGIFGK